MSEQEKDAADELAKAADSVVNGRIWLGGEPKWLAQLREALDAYLEARAAP